MTFDSFNTEKPRPSYNFLYARNNFFDFTYRNSRFLVNFRSDAARLIQKLKK